MRTLSNLTKDERIHFGKMLGEHCLGSGVDPERLLEDGFLLNQDISVGKEAMNDLDICEGFDSVTFMCEQCGWYCGEDEQNDTAAGQMCDDCMMEEDD